MSAKTRAAIKLIKLIGISLVSGALAITALELIPTDILIPTAMSGFLVYFLYCAYKIFVSMEEAEDRKNK